MRWTKKIVVIPHHAGDNERARNLNIVLKHLREYAIPHGWAVMVYEMGSCTTIIDCPEAWHIVSRDRWGKAKAWNEAFKTILDAWHPPHDTGDIDKTLVCLLDNDIIFDDPSFFKESDPLRGYRYAHPYKDIYDSDMVDVWDIEKYGFLDTTDVRWNNLRLGSRCYGGASLMSLGDIVRVGGFSEEFGRWGHEDDLFHYCMLRLVGFANYNRHPTGVVHLNHKNLNTRQHLTSKAFLDQQAHLYEMIGLLKDSNWGVEFRRRGKYIRYHERLLRV